MLASQSVAIVCLLLGNGAAPGRTSPGIQKATEQGQLTVRVVNGRLAFDTVAHYDSTVTDQDTVSRERTVAYLRALPGFISQGEMQEGREKHIDHDFFAEVLNADLVVQIGGTIFRVDPWVERVFALQAEFEEQYNDLIAANASNPNIRVFSTDENVLDSYSDPLSSAGLPRLFGWWKKLFPSSSGCTENVAPSDEEYVAFTSGTFPIEASCTGGLRYRKFGIFYTLFAELEYTPHNLSPLYRGYITLEPVKYKILCGSTTGPYNVFEYNSGSAFFYEKYQSWQGSKRLSKFHLRGKFKVVNEVTLAFTESNWIEIKRNY